MGQKGVGGLPEQREKVPWKDMTLERLWRTCSPLWRSHHFGDMLERESAGAGVVQEWLPLSRRHLGLDGPWGVVREAMLDNRLQTQLQVSRLQVKGGAQVQVEEVKELMPPLFLSGEAQGQAGQAWAK